MKEPVRIISDLHLGHKVSRIPEVSHLRSLVAGAGTVIFNGDVWQELPGPFRERSAAMLEDLKSLCADEGCETVFLSGNHDPGWPGPGWVAVAGGKIIVTHGDALLLDCSPWKREILTGRATIEEIWCRFPRADVDLADRIRLTREIARALPTIDHSRGRRLLQRVWDAVSPPRRALKIIESWYIQGRAGRRFCDTFFPAAEFLLVGHFHRHGNWLHGGRRILNTGSFVNPGRACWAEWNAGWLNFGFVAESPGRFEKGETLGAWRVVHEDGIEPPTNPV